VSGGSELKGRFEAVRGRGRGLENLHDEELRNVYSSPNIIRMIRSRRVR
jgi:hypothetical protein